MKINNTTESEEFQKEMERVTYRISTITTTIVRYFQKKNAIKRDIKNKNIKIKYAWSVESILIKIC